MGKIKVAFFDIDGTLADNEQAAKKGIYARIPASAREAIKKLKENGIEPVLATGRNLDVLETFDHKLGVESLVSSNGTYVVYQGQTIAAHPMSNTIVKKIIKELEAAGVDYLLETPHSLYHKATAKPIASSSAQNINVFTQNNLPAEIIQVIYHINEKGKLNLNMPELLEEKVAPHAYCIHMRSISKATGIMEILEQMELTPENAVAFGDEENDLAMFDLVKYPIAMGNATDALKKKAFYVTNKVGEDGIWNACKKLGLF